MKTEQQILRNREIQKAYYERNKTKRRAKINEWKEANPEKQLSYVKKYTMENKEKVAAYQHNYQLQSIKFKGKSIHTDHIVRKGSCQNCGKTGLTNMHHTQYDSNNPLAHTIELCISCHNKEHGRIGNE